MSESISPPQLPSELNPNLEVAFLPLQLTRTVGHSLARVDAASLRDLMRHHWRITANGRVFRQYYDLVNSRAEGKTVVSYEALARRVLKCDIRADFAFRNGDVLDLRLQNLIELKAGEPKPETPDVGPGSSFRELPEFPAAYNYRSANAATLASAFIVGRKSKLSNEQVRKLLDLVKDNVFGLAEAPLHMIADVIFDETRVKMTMTQVSQLLRGTLRYQEGYDYAAIRKVRPTAEQRAMQRQARRLKPDQWLIGTEKL
jgi:hypothetical protein